MGDNKYYIIPSQNRQRLASCQSSVEVEFTAKFYFCQNQSSLGVYIAFPAR